MSIKTIADLREAKYNPRHITDKQLKNLKSSIERFGDLSGVVFNTKLGELVSGHQRLKTLKGKKTKIVKTKATDHCGTTFVGHIEVYEDGGTIKIPYREVHWDDKLQTMAANVAANAAGGEFDQAKLGAIMAKLEKGKFQVELTSLDSWTTAKAIGKFKKSLESDGEEASSKKTRNASDAEGDGDDDEDSGLSIVDPTAMAFAHCCPRCGYQWGDAPKPETKEKKAVAEKAPAKKLAAKPEEKAKVVKSKKSVSTKVVATAKAAKKTKFSSSGKKVR